MRLAADGPFYFRQRNVIIVECIHVVRFRECERSLGIQDLNLGGDLASVTYLRQAHALPGLFQALLGCSDALLAFLQAQIGLLCIERD